MTNLKTFRVVEYTVLSGGESGTYYDGTINVSLSGYTMISVAGYKVTSAGAFVYNINADYATNTVKMGVGTMVGATLSNVYAYVYVLYYKN